MSRKIDWPFLDTWDFRVNWSQWGPLFWLCTVMAALADWETGVWLGWGATVAWMASVFAVMFRSQHLENKARWKAWKEEEREIRREWGLDDDSS